MNFSAENIILSICVPTYNRGYLLDNFFTRLEQSLSKMSCKIEIYVSNNASSDITSFICQEWKNKLSCKYSFKYYEQSVNIGLINNILFLFENASGKYFMFIGDDDFLYEDAMLSIDSILKSDQNPSAIIQGKWGNKMITSFCGYVFYKEAAKLFYEYGNAYAAIIDREAANRILLDKYIRSEVEQIVWPQTVIGFLTIYSLKEKPIYVTNFSIGGPLTESQNLTNKSYWVTSFYGLLKAGYLIDEHVGFNWTKKAFIRFTRNGFWGHMKAILNYSILSNQFDSSSVRIILNLHYGLWGKLCSLILYFSDKYPNLIRVCHILFFSLYKFQHPNKVYKQLLMERKSYSEKAVQKVGNKKRFGDWF